MVHLGAIFGRSKQRSTKLKSHSFVENQVVEPWIAQTQASQIFHDFPKANPMKVRLTQPSFTHKKWGCPKKWGATPVTTSSTHPHLPMGFPTICFPYPFLGDPDDCGNHLSSPKMIQDEASLGACIARPRLLAERLRLDDVCSQQRPGTRLALW